MNTETKEEVICHTNQIEVAWNQLPQFDDYLVEVMWRANAKSEVYTKFFDLAKSVYHLDGPCEFSQPHCIT